MIPPILPPITDLDSYRPIYRQEEVWLPAMRIICARHGLDPSSLSFAPPGSNVVFWVEKNRVIKLFAPLWEGDAARESGWLIALSAKTGFHTPEICAQGELENWPYLVLSRVPGTPLDEIWPALAQDEEVQIADSLGTCLAWLHGAVQIGVEASRAAGWDPFRRSQLENSPARQAQLGCSKAWVDNIAQFVTHLPVYSSNLPDLVLVNGDLNPEHLFCEKSVTGWQVTGMIDFGDALVGHPFYDFVRPGFIFRGSPHLRRRMLRAYGFAEQDLTPSLTRELFAYVLIHRFANIPETLSEYESAPPANLEELISSLWGF